MAPLQPLQQTVFEQGPQSAPVPSAAPAFVFEEGQVIRPEPINPVQATDPGIAWNALGAEAMGIASNLYEKTLNYLIDTKAANLSDITLSKEDELNKISFDAALLQQRAKENPYSAINFQEEAKKLGKQIREVEQTWATQASEILGPEDYAAFTADDVDFSKLGTKWQQLAMGTKKTKLDLSNQIRKVLTDLAVMNLDFKETTTKVEAFQLGSYKMTNEEMLKVPYAPTLFGTAPIPADQLVTQGLRTLDGKPLMDSNNNPAYVEVVNPRTQETEYYLNVRPNPYNQGIMPFDFEQLPSRALEFIAFADNTTFADDRGINIHPKYLEFINSTLMTQTPTKAQYEYWKVAIRKIPPSKLVPALLQNRSGMNAKEAARISMMYALSKTNAKWEEAERILSINPDETFDLFEGLSTLSPTTSSNGDRVINFNRSNNLQLNQDLISGVNIAGEIYAKQLGMFGQEKVPDEFLLQTSREAYRGTTNYIDPPGSGSVIDDIILRDPNFKYFASRAVTVARLATQGIGDPEKRKEAFDSAVRESIEIQLNAAGATPVNGIMVINPNLSSINQFTEADFIKQAAATAGADPETIAQLESWDASKKTQVVGKTILRMQSLSQIKPTDSPEQVREKQLTFIRNAGRGRISEVAAQTLYDNLIEVESTNEGQLITSHGLSDGVLLQIVLASMPDAWHLHGFKVEQGNLVYTAGLQLPPEKQVQYANSVLSNTGPAWNWDINFDMTNFDVLESQEGGLPIQFTSIPLQSPQTKGKDTISDLVPYLFARNQDMAKTWTPRNAGNIPLLLVNNQTLTAQATGRNVPDNERFTKKYAEQMADEAAFLLTKQRQFTSGVQKKTDNSPSFFANNTIEYPLLSLNEQQYRPNPNDFAYVAFEDPSFGMEPIDNAMELAGIINGSIGLTEQYSANDPVLSSKKNNPLENFAKQWKTERGLFSRKNLEKLVKWAQTQTNPDGTPAFVTAADYLSLMGAVTREYVKNSSKGVSLNTYNHKALEAETEMETKEINAYTQYAGNKQFPPFLTQGENKGQILFSAIDENLWSMLNQLSKDGFTIVTEMNTQRLYAIAPNEPVDTDRFILMNNSIISQRMANERLGLSLQITPKKPTTKATIMGLQENRKVKRQEAFKKYVGEVRARPGKFRD